MSIKCENGVVVPVVKILENRPVNRRVGTFPEVLSMTDRGYELGAYAA